LEAAQEIVGWAPIEEGKAITLKTFSRDAAANLIPLRMVQLFSVEAQFQTYPRKDTGQMVEKIEFMCGMPVAVVSPFSPKVMLARAMDLHQLPVQLADATNPYPGAMVSYFEAYLRTLDDEDEGRGCVISKKVSNSSKTEDYLFTPQDKPTQLAMTYRMTQLQDASNPTFPVAGQFLVQAQFFEGSAEEQKGGRAILRREFGINDPKVWSEIMSAQAIPAIIAGSINMKSSLAMNPGRDHTKDTGYVPFYANAVYAELRRYLLTRCLKVSKAWVWRKLKLGGNPNDKVLHMDRSNPNNQNLLNNANLRFDETDSSRTLINGMVINIASFTGDVNETIARCATPCEFRVLHSVPLDDATRVQLAQLDTAEAEKCLAGAEGSVKPLEQPTVVIYLVATYSEEEKVSVSSMHLC
jgi:hypothetical protein